MRSYFIGYSLNLLVINQLSHSHLKSYTILFYEFSQILVYGKLLTKEINSFRSVGKKWNQLIKILQKKNEINFKPRSIVLVSRMVMLDI